MSELWTRTRLFRRFLLIVCLLISLYLVFCADWSSSRNQLDLKTLTTQKNPDTLAVDELEPDIYTVNVPEIDQTGTEIRVQAEATDRPEGSRILHYRSGYTGIGYLSDLPSHTESALAVNVKVPATQHYAVTICAASNRTVTNALRINGNLLSPFTLEGNAKFMRITFYGIFLEEGTATLAIDTIDNGLDIDYIELCNDSSIYDSDFQIDAEPCDPNATENTRKLYQFLCEQWGSHMLTGQYASNGANRELLLIYQITGQLPAIRFGELGNGHDLAQIEAATDWYLDMHGIVGLMWQWKAPGSDSVYSQDTDFDLQKALQGQNMQSLAAMTTAEAEAAAESGEISDEALLLLRDIDETAGSLRKLCNMDIPVLWRPLHEAGGGWYWWGAAGEEAYVQLWNLLYYRLTDYHGIHNLIWIWNGQSSSYLVPEHTYDIASVDVYLQPHMAYGSRYEQYLSLARITDEKKLLALSECSSLPSPEMIRLDRSVWSFFGLWYGEYLMNSDGTFNDTYYSSSDLYNLYNSDQTLSLNDFLLLFQ